MLAHGRKCGGICKEIRQNQKNRTKQNKNENKNKNIPPRKQIKKGKKENFLGEKGNKPQMYKLFDKAGIIESWNDLG